MNSLDWYSMVGRVEIMLLIKKLFSKSHTNKKFNAKSCNQKCLIKSVTFCTTV